MIVLPDRTVLLAEGETVPVFCACEHIYQPEAGSDASRCPACGAGNLHWEQEVAPVEPDPERG